MFGKGGLGGSRALSRAPPWVPDRGPARRHVASMTVLGGCGSARCGSKTPRPAPPSGAHERRPYEWLFESVGGVAAPVLSPTVGTGLRSGKTTLRRQDEGGWCCRRRARPGPHRGYRIGVRQDDSSPARRGTVVLQSPRPSRAPPWVPDRSPARRHFAGKTREGGVVGAAPVLIPTVGAESESSKTTLRRQDEGGWCCRRRARPKPHRGCRIGVRQDGTSPARRHFAGKTRS